MREKSKARFNIIDFLIIVALLASLFVLIFRGTIIDFIGDIINTQDATVTVVIQGVDTAEADMLKKEDTLYWNGELFGRVEEISITDSRELVLSDANTSGPSFVSIIVPDKCDIECTITVRGAFLEDGFHLSGSYYLGVGKTVELYSDSFYCSAIITSIA